MGGSTAEDPTPASWQHPCGTLDGAPASYGSSATGFHVPFT